MSDSLIAVSHCRFILLLGAQALILFFLASVMAQTGHPLDPLSANEIKVAAKALKASGQFPQTALFSTIVLKEPAKTEVLNYKSGAQFSRQAFSVIMDRTGNRTFEAVVDLKTQRVLSWHEARGVQPREGLVLHTVGYEDDGRLHPILYPASLSEMVVPYGAPDQNWRWRSAFD